MTAIIYAPIKLVGDVKHMGALHAAECVVVDFRPYREADGETLYLITWRFGNSSSDTYTGAGSAREIRNRTCWWYLYDSVALVQFDDGRRAVDLSVHIVIWLIIIGAAVMLCGMIYNVRAAGMDMTRVPPHYFTLEHCERADGAYEFLAGHLPTAGRNSSIHRHFQNNALYAPQLTRMILSYVDGRVAVRGT